VRLAVPRAAVSAGDGTTIARRRAWCTTWSETLPISTDMSRGTAGGENDQRNIELVDQTTIPSATAENDASRRHRRPAAPRRDDARTDAVR